MSASRNGGVQYVTGEPSWIGSIPLIDDVIPEQSERFGIHLSLPPSDCETCLFWMNLEVLIYDTDVLALTQSVQYAYDAFDQLVRRTLDADGPGPAAATDSFYSWQDGQIVLQFDGGQESDLSHRYLWGPQVDQLLFAEEGDFWWENAPGTVRYPLADQLGTIRDIAEYDAATNETEVITHRIYDSYGNLIDEDETVAVDLLFGFTGRLFDDATGKQYNLHRWYDPKTGQWLSEDPIGFTARDTNLRRYVSNNPLSFVDSSGLIGDGHHYVNQANWGGMSSAARGVFDSLGARIRNDWYKGHNFSKINGYSHDQYNEAVRKALDDYLNGRNPGSMTGDDAKSLLQRIKCSSDPIISEFNKGVQAEANAAANAGKAGADAAKQAGKGAGAAEKAGLKDAKKAVDTTRKRLNDAAAKRAQKAVAKKGGKSIGKRIWDRIPVVSGIISGAAAWWNTGDWRAAGREVVLDGTGLDLSRDAAELAAEGYDFAERDRDASAQSVRDNFWRVP